MNIPIGTIGRILNSTHKDHLVRVEDDNANTGGFLIYERWESSDGPNADGWVENSNSLSQFFSEAKWGVQWTANL